MTTTTPKDLSNRANDALGKGGKKTSRITPTEDLIEDFVHRLTEIKEDAIVSLEERDELSKLFTEIWDRRLNELEKIGISEEACKKMPENFNARILYETIIRLPVDEPLEQGMATNLLIRYQSYKLSVEQEEALQDLAERNGKIQRNLATLAISKGVAAPNAQQQSAPDKNKDAMKKYVQILEKKTPEQVMKEIEEEFVGLDDIKEKMYSLIAVVEENKVNEKDGIPPIPFSKHIALTGNPGTGKTTIARKYAELLHALDLSGNRFVEISRDKMVGEHIGAAEGMANALFELADIIFVDEAYNLAPSGDGGDRKDFGYRIIDALNVVLENKRETFVGIFAGYSKEMMSFFSANPGIASRIDDVTRINDPSMETLGTQLQRLLDKYKRVMDPETKAHAMKRIADFKEEIGEKFFGNGRVVRKMIEKLPICIAMRNTKKRKENPGLELTVAERTTILKADVDSLNFAALQEKEKEAAKPDFSNLHPHVRQTNNAFKQRP